MWIWWKDLKAETESGMMSTQNQMLQTKHHTTKLLQTETEGKCQQYDETVVRIISAYQILVKKNISSDVVGCGLNYTLIYAK